MIRAAFLWLGVFLATPAFGLSPVSPLSGRGDSEPRLEKIFRAILESLGSVNPEEPAQTLRLPEFPSIRQACAIPFVLSREGAAVFAEMLKTEPHLVSPRAHVLFIEGRPAGMAVRHHFGKGLFFLTFSAQLFGRPDGAEGEISRECLAALYPRGEDAVRQFSTLHLVEVPPYHLRRPGTPPALRLLSIRHDRHEEGGVERPARLPELFAPDDLASVDYQQILHRNRGLFPGKKVMEIGAGTGVNAIWALRFGAGQVRGTEISFAYHALSRWNLAYAEETGQIPPGSAAKVELIRGNGFAGVPDDADLYLFNTPRVGKADDMPWIVEGVEYLDLMAYNILAEQFFPLFAELKRRLAANGSLGIWRILIGEGALGLGAPSREELYRSLNLSPLQIAGSRLLSEFFLRRENISFAMLSPEMGPPGDIYLLSVESSL